MTQESQNDAPMKQNSAVKKGFFFQEFTGTGIPMITIGNITIPMSHHESG
jgi:hypothetical protein